MNIESPQDLFFHDLCAMYDAELKLAQILPELAKESQSQQARDAFLEHQKETVQHAKNLEQCFQIMGRPVEKVENHAVIGLKEDHETFLQHKPSPTAITMFDIEAASKSEFLEMASYHALIGAAKHLGLQQCVPLFEQNLQQEEAAAKKLAMIAHELSQKAAQKAA